MTTLKIRNFSNINIREIGELSSDIAAAATGVPLISVNGFLTSNWVIIGGRCSERAEILPVSSINTSTNTLTVATATTFVHSKFDEVVMLFGNTIRIYTAPNTDGTAPASDQFTYLADVLIQPDQLETIYEHTLGDSDTWYKFTYRNPTTSTETSIENSVAVRGGGVDRYATIDDIRQEAGISNNVYITDSSIDAKRRSAEAHINSTLSGTYTVPFTAPVSPIIERIAILLTAGYVLSEQYGPVNVTNTKRGSDKIAEANDLLNKLDTKQLILLDASGTNATIPTTAAGVSGWPNSSTATSTGGSERSFTMADRA